MASAVTRPSERGVSDLSSASDAVLLERCAAADTVAWEHLVARYERLTFSIARREGLDVEAAADVTQSVFATLLERLDDIREPDRLGSWLATVTRRTSWRVTSRASREGPLDDIEIVADEPEYEQALWVHRAVHDLNEPCRTIVVSLFFDPTQPSYDEIATGIGRPVGSVGPMRARCLQTLKRLLSETTEGAA